VPKATWTKIGEGGFAVVYKATWRGQTVAIKEVKLKDDALLQQVGSATLTATRR
jgi:hypothetical protein